MLGGVFTATVANHFRSVFAGRYLAGNILYLNSKDFNLSCLYKTALKDRSHHGCKGWQVLIFIVSFVIISS